MSEQERLALLQPSLARSTQEGRELDQLERLAATEAYLYEQEPEDENARGLWRAARARSAVGTPDQLREYLKKYEDGHQDVMLFIAQSGTRKHEDIMASIELFGREVLPEFKERHETVHRPWRQRQLERFEFPVNSSV